MRQFALSVSASLMLLAPGAAFAAYETPGALIKSIQEHSARAFSVSAHGQAGNTFVSVWSKGASEGSEPLRMTMQNATTLDIARGSDTLRAKGDMLVWDGSLYLRVNSIVGSIVKPFDTSSLGDGSWASLPFTREMAHEMNSGVALDIGSFDTEIANAMFTMKHWTQNGITTYTLSLSKDFAPELGMRIRNMLGDTEPVSDDFLPWEALGRATKATMTIVTAGDVFKSSSLKMTMKLKNSAFESSTTETALKEGLRVERPKNVVRFDHFQSALASWIGAPVDMSSDPTESGNLWTEEGPSPSPNFETVDEVTDAPSNCSDPLLSPQALVLMQRQGACPSRQVKKVDLYR